MPKTPKTVKSDVIYPKLNFLWKIGKDAMTLEEAKKYLGWEEDTAEEKFTDFDMELPNGRRVVFKNNRRNRIWRPLQLKVLKQDHLNKRFRFNPDGFGIGATGQIISCQHRLRSFCEAEIERQGNPEKWGDEPLTMECIVVTGMDESDETFRILNLTTPANAADAFYRQQLFPKQTRQNRAKLCTYLESAIKCLWVRTGANKDDKTPVLTNDAAVEFYEKHPKLADCVLHIFESYSSGKGHSQRMSPGQASALMWLMACSGTMDTTKYDKKPCDKSLDWSFEAKAQDFWTELCNESPTNGFEFVKDVLDKLCSDDEPLSGMYERKCVLARAWNLYRKDSAITVDLVKPSDTHPDFGGIDCNESLGQVESEKEDPPVTDEQVNEEKAKIDEAKSGGPAAKTETTDKDDAERALITSLRVRFRNKILLLKTKTEFLVWEEDADTLCRIIPTLTPKTYTNGMKYVGFPTKKQVDLFAKLKNAKKKSVIVTLDKDGVTPICTDPDTGNAI